MIYFAISMAFVIGICIASVLWSRDVQSKERQKALNQTPELKGKPPFKRVSQIMTPEEATLYKMLKYVIADDGHVLAKVQLSSLLTLKSKETRRDFYMNIAKSRQVDFVICHSKSTAPVLVIQTTDTGVKITKDEQELIEGILQAASLPLLKLSVRQALGPVEMKAKLRDAMNQLTDKDIASTNAA